MTTSVIIRIVLIVALLVFLVAWRSGLAEKWKNRGKTKESEKLAAEKAEAHKRRLAQKRKKQEEADRTSRILSRAAESAELSSEKIAGEEIFYLHAGEPGGGPSLLLLHGLADRKEDWGPTIERLASLGCRVVAPDLPGFGQSVSGDQDPDALVHLRRLRPLAQKLRLEPCVLVGSGLGGTLAAAWAYREPDSVRGLVLIEPFGLRVPYPSELDERLEAGGGNPLLPASPTDFDTLDELLFETPPERDPDIVQLRRREMTLHRAHHQKVWERSRQEDRLGVLDLVLPELRHPLLYVQGEQSKVVHPKTAELVRTLDPGTFQIRTIPACGHLPHVEKSQETGSALLGFLQGLPAEPSEAAS